MKKLNLLEIETRWGYKTFELYHGDITKLEFTVDVLAVSAFYGNYEPVPHTVIGALLNNCGIDVGELARRPEFNLKEVFNCWVARLPGDAKFKRVLCVEFADGGMESHEAIENLFVTLSILEAKRIKVRTLALPILGTGNQVLAPAKIIKALLDCSLKHMNLSQNLKRIIFVEVNKDRARQLDKSMNDTLGRVKVVMPKGALSEQLRKEIIQGAESAAALAGPKGHELFSDLRRLINSDQSRSFEIGIIARRLVEFVADDLLHKKKGFDLCSKIENLSERGVADWMRSYMHVLRILGNESAHEKDKADRVPANIDEADMALCFFCLQRVLDFWVTLSGTSEVARP